MIPSVMYSQDLLNLFDRPLANNGGFEIFNMLDSSYAVVSLLVEIVCWGF